MGSFKFFRISALYEMSREPMSSGFALWRSSWTISERQRSSEPLRSQSIGRDRCQCSWIVACKTRRIDQDALERERLPSVLIGLEGRVYRFALKSKHAEDALMQPVERLTRNKSGERFDTQSEFTQG